MRDPAFLAFLESIAANVRRVRLRRGFTQEVLAERAGQDLSYLQRIERGATNLSVGVLFALSVALDVSPGILVRKARYRPARRGRPPKRTAHGA
jgi:transcriptional regulator with XRE-family HTH domain